MRKFIFPLAAVVLLALSCEKGPEEVAVSSVSINQATAEMLVGEKKQLSATITPADATDQSIKWSSSKKSVATVSDQGMVTAIAEGQTTIKAQAGGKTSVCVVTVRKEIIAVTSITLDKNSLSLVKGESETLTATVNPSGATHTNVSWSSSDSNVASVDSKGKVKAVASGNATITAQVDGITATCTVTVTVPVESITLNKTKITLNKGESETLIATITPSDATENVITWTSSNIFMAPVDSNGKVTAVGGGNVTITAKAGSKVASCTVTVIVPVESITLNMGAITLNEGETATLKATVLPKDASEQVVTWSSSDESIVTVDQKGKINAVKQGTADILAQAGDKQATCKVTVIKKVSSITLDKESLTLLVGETSTLTATVLPDDATDKTITWISYDSNVATVENGVVKGIGCGETIISAFAGSFVATCSIVVLMDSAVGVSAAFIGGDYTIIDDVVQPGSELKFRIGNFSSETIQVVSLKLIDGQTGAGEYELSLDSEIEPGSHDSWTVTIGDSGIYSPTARFVYTFMGETYTCDAKVAVIPKAPRRY